MFAKQILGMILVFHNNLLSSASLEITETTINETLYDTATSLFDNTKLVTANYTSDFVLTTITNFTNIGKPFSNIFDCFNSIYIGQQQTSEYYITCFLLIRIYIEYLII